MSDLTSIILAGSTGLIGHHLLNSALKNEEIQHVYSLTRRPLDDICSKLIQVINPELSIDKEQVKDNVPKVGFITLGTTIKKAGSKSALKAIDVSLVVSVAQSMHDIGVERIYVVSCIGASSSAFSHYLKCKGEMEDKVADIGFKQVTFMQPGPLSGSRTEPRTDEAFLQGVMKVMNPLMKGFLLNYKPIHGELVAQCMLELALKNNHDNGIVRYTSREMFALVEQ
ncbi:MULTISPECIES: NAD(P)H-binding protein [Aliivibrio]|uniref:Nucleoside-diphosphate sugar epimerase n=1 Tax=Aliivibrio sifiae TaxID=566293 RepID=A0A2S7X4Y7_9GAMM|nr:NAD(P)H-binding protein [Aliivibrio sifiae]PQJ85068.1 nucleoside-diphosphate sugar epimerase [Aliivibrio sifiae]